MKKQEERKEKGVGKEEWQEARRGKKEGKIRGRRGRDKDWMDS